MPTKSDIFKLRSEMLERHAAELAELDREIAIFKMMDGPILPLVSNHKRHGTQPLEPAVWLSFMAPTSGSEAEQWDPPGLLAMLEASGWSLAPAASMVKWGRYRPSIHACTPGEAEKAKRYVACPPSLPPDQWDLEEFVGAEEVLPVWIEPNQFTKVSVSCFMVAPDGRLARVGIEAPRVPVSLDARRAWGGHDWSYTPGTAKIHYPTAWKVHPATSAWLPTSQGLKGEVYFPATRRPVKASSFLRSLLTHHA